MPDSIFIRLAFVNNKMRLEGDPGGIRAFRMTLKARSSLSLDLG
jgi:hypothetical protein